MRQYQPSDHASLKQGIYAFLPKHYLCSLEETTQATLVHWKALGVKYRANPKTGHKKRSQDGLWGGEGWISGFRYANNDKLSTRLESVWKPQLFTRELYSEILNHKLTITVTARTLDLIDAAYGFDYYILRVRERNTKEDLRRAMLLRLSFKDTQLDPEDPVKKDLHQQFEIPAEEAEWVGLSVDEAVEEQRQLEHKEPEPLFKSCVENPVKELAIQKLSEPQLMEEKVRAIFFEER
uniref:Large ribosomal subunit protein bL28m n=1 Tax=Oncorhynchus tshawytscha TaxID=74940 RepID=A0A8C8LPP7_ONCTS